MSVPVFDQLRQLASCVDGQLTQLRRARDDPMSALSHDPTDTLLSLRAEIEQLGVSSAASRRHLSGVGSGQLQQLAGAAEMFLQQTRRQVDDTELYLQRFGYCKPVVADAGGDQEEASGDEVPAAADDEGRTSGEPPAAAAGDSAPTETPANSPGRDEDDDTTAISAMLNLRAVPMSMFPPVSPALPALGAAGQALSRKSTAAGGGSSHLLSAAEGDVVVEVSPGLFVRRPSILNRPGVASNGSRHQMTAGRPLGPMAEEEAVHRPTVASAAVHRQDSVTPPTPDVSEYTRQLIARFHHNGVSTATRQLPSTAGLAAGDDTPPPPEISENTRRMLNIR